MLTETQKDNLSGLLYLLQPEDIKALANTVTNSLITPVDYEEAVSTILQYTVSVSALLNRKKITKELVFRYLHQNQVDGVTPQLDKRSMIELLLSHWGETESSLNSSNDMVDVQANSSHPCSNSSPLQSPAESPQQALPPRDDLWDMAEKFATWFYTLLNIGLSDEGQMFGPEHFWPDCFLQINFQSPTIQIQEERDNGEATAVLLAQMCRHFNLFFNPNLSREGISCRSEPHGAVVVIVHGTVHQQNTCAGIYEQKFLLLRDPGMQNNWRVKRTEISLKTDVHTNKAIQAGESSILRLPYPYS